MKFSFSTKGWHDHSFEEFCAIAEDLHFEGIEPHNIRNRIFSEKDSVFHDYSAATTLRMLFERNLKLPCIDVITDIGDPEMFNNSVEEIKSCLRIAICGLKCRKTAGKRRKSLEGTVLLSSGKL